MFNGAGTTIKDEVQRKSLDALIWVHGDWKSGKLKAKEAQAAVDGAFMVASGLVDEETLELFTQISEEIKGEL